jgi:hypothetical protein
MLLGWQRISSRFYVSFFLCEKSRKGVGREECENSREIVKRKGVGGVSGGGENEEEETSVRKVEKEYETRVGIPGRSWRGKGLIFFLGRSSGKISLACGNLWCDGHPTYSVYAIGIAEDF